MKTTQFQERSSVNKSPDIFFKSSLKDKKTERMTLTELWDSVKNTSIGSKFINQLKKPPKLSWGNCSFRAEINYDSNTITLNKKMQNDISDNEWKQIIVMELGNATQHEALDEVYKNAKIYNRENFIKAVEKIEFDTRVQVINAYVSGEFCNPINTPQCKSVFDTSVTLFEDYISDKRGSAHREAIGEIWDDINKK